MPVQAGSLSQSPYKGYSAQYKPMPVGHFGQPATFDDKWTNMFGSIDALSKPGGGDVSAVFVDGQRKRVNLVAIVLNVFLPWIMFSGVYMMVSFKFHYQRPGTMWLIVLACAFFVLMVASLGYKSKSRNRTPMWFTFATISLSIALVMAVVGGEWNYEYYTKAAYTINALNTYPHVNPAVERGTQLMDAGKVYFADGAKLDFAKGMGFKEEDIYCVVPITSGPAGSKLDTYDFWAVGVNCCSGGADFKCGEFNNPKARSGMRQINDDQRPFFRLAVQEAEAAYNIKATHPIFFTWVQDPLADMERLAVEGWRIYIVGVCCFFGVNALAVGLAVVGFSKLGHYPTF